MSTKYALLLLAAASVATSSVRAQTPEDPVLDLMVRKGLVSQAEADKAKEEAKQLEDQRGPTQITFLDSSIKQVQFYGDGRLRYENIDQHNHSEVTAVTDRERYRLRFGVDYLYSDHLKGGFELESGTTNDSANQTFGGMFTKSSINVGKIYLQYSPTDWLTATAGKFTNPWYTTTDMVYSMDLNPEGGAELFNFHPTDGLTVGLTAVQYLYINSNEGVFPKGINNNDVQIIGNQIPITWKIDKDVTFKIAPGFTFYTGGGNTSFDGGIATNTNISGVTPTLAAATANSAVDPVFVSSKEADDLAVFSAPGEFNFKVADVPFRPYWDFELNTEGKQRVQNVYLDSTSPTPGNAPVAGAAAAALAKKQNQDLGDNLAWAVGLQIGQNKKKGDWSGLAEFRQIGLGAVDQNINGTDYADSYANQEGFKFASAYNFTDFLTATVTFYDTWDYKKGLYQAIGGTAAAPTAGTTQYLVSEKSLQRIQVDLGWKF